MITTRHVEVSDEMQEIASEVVGRVARKANRPHRAEIIFDEEHRQKIVELRLFMARGQTKVGRAEADDFRTAVDRAADKLKNHLDRTALRSRKRAVNQQP